MSLSRLSAYRSLMSKRQHVCHTHEGRGVAVADGGIPYSFPLIKRHEHVLLERYRLDNDAIKYLHHEHGAPLKVTGTGNGRRYYVCIPALDAWFSSTEITTRKADENGERTELGNVARFDRIGDAQRAAGDRGRPRV